jgi:hypothetical protein
MVGSTHRIIYPYQNDYISSNINPNETHGEIRPHIPNICPHERYLETLIIIQKSKDNNINKTLSPNHKTIRFKIQYRNGI